MILHQTTRATTGQRAATVAATVAVALGALGLPATQADAATQTTAASSRAAMRLAEHPLATRKYVSPARAAVKYVIRDGDTLSGIARRHHTTVPVLRSANHLSSSRIYAGDNLTIPPAGTTTWGSPETTHRPQSKAHARHTRGATVSGQYTIRAGDTLSGIARAHGVTEAALRAANPALGGSSRIIAGKTLNLPGHTSTHRTPKHQTSKHQGRKHSQQRKHTQHRSGASQVSTTFAGRTYKPHVTRAAQANKDALHRRHVPSRSQMQAMVVATARAQGVDPRLAQALAYQESGFNMRAVSPANAVGVMQVIPSSVKWASQMTGQDLDALNPEHNVLAGIVVLKANLQATGWDVDKAVAGYYQGLRSVNKNGMYADTQSYVKSVTALMGRF